MEHFMINPQEMHQNLDVRLSILKDLYTLQQNNLLGDVVGFTEDRRIGKT